MWFLRVSRMFARRKKPSYWDYSVNCSGTEAHLSSCKLGQLVTQQANGTCAGGQPVVVSCVPGRAFAPSAMTGFRKAFRQEVREQPARNLEPGDTRHLSLPAWRAGSCCLQALLGNLSFTHMHSVFPICQLCNCLWFPFTTVQRSAWSSSSGTKSTWNVAFKSPVSLSPATVGASSGRSHRGRGPRGGAEERRVGNHM